MWLVCNVADDAGMETARLRCLDCPGASRGVARTIRREGLSPSSKFVRKKSYDISTMYRVILMCYNINYHMISTSREDYLKQIPMTNLVSYFFGVSFLGNFTLIVSLGKGVWPPCLLLHKTILNGEVVSLNKIHV